jgi:hypothetical protein
MSYYKLLWELKSYSLQHGYVRWCFIFKCALFKQIIKKKRVAKVKKTQIRQVKNVNRGSHTITNKRPDTWPEIGWANNRPTEQPGVDWRRIALGGVLYKSKQRQTRIWLVSIQARGQKTNVRRYLAKTRALISNPYITLCPYYFSQKLKILSPFKVVRLN